MKTLVPSHPKTRMLADELGIRLSEAVGILAILWNYAKQNAKDGDLSSLTPKRLAILMGWPSSDGQRLYDGLAEAGWVDRHPHTDGAFVVHDWLEHCEAYILRDLVAAGRVQKVDPRATPIAALYGGSCHDMQCMQNKQDMHGMFGSPSPSSPTSTPPPKKKTTPADAGSGSFDAWWAMYPVRGEGIPRGNKRKAWAEWVKLGDDARAEVVEATRRLIKSGTYPKDAERFLKGSKGADPPYRAFLDDSPAPTVIGGKDLTTHAERKDERNVAYDDSWTREPNHG